MSEESSETESKILTPIDLKPGRALVMRVCREGGRSYALEARGFTWPTEIGAECVAPDWNPTPECGYGLHGWLWGVGDVAGSGASWAFEDPNAVWMVVEVDASSIVAIEDVKKKVKFPRGVVRFVGSAKDCAALIAPHAPVGSSLIAGTATAGARGTATAGYAGTATAGDAGTATAGARGTATAGYAGTATAGYAGTATAGYAGTATAGYAGTATAGARGTATAGDAGIATAGARGTATAGYAGTATAGYAGTATAGARGTATAGDAGIATAGDAGTATAGARGTATAGARGTATAGDAGTATAGARGTATAGARGTATAGEKGCIFIKRWDAKLGRYRWVMGEVGIDGIEANVPYVLDDAGKLVKKSNEK